MVDVHFGYAMDIRLYTLSHSLRFMSSASLHASELNDHLYLICNQGLDVRIESEKEQDRTQQFPKSGSESFVLSKLSRLATLWD